jgi:hypothetical protein
MITIQSPFVFFSKLEGNISEMLKMRGACWIRVGMHASVASKIGRLLNQWFQRPEKLGKKKPY